MYNYLNREIEDTEYCFNSHTTCEHCIYKLGGELEEERVGYCYAIERTCPLDEPLTLVK